VLRTIHRTATERGADALTAQEVKRAALQRVFGFEIMPAPLVVAHLQLGMLLQELGAPLDDDERAAVYLTNSLTGWQPGAQPPLPLPELQQEREAAEHVKREAPILVVLGNPPYNAFAGVSATTEEREIIRPYKEGLRRRWGIKKSNLDELSVRFYRLAERRIVETTGQGVVCLISNFSYLDGLSLVVMRERYLQEFDRIWVDNLNGDSRETGKRTPEGRPDPSIFSTPLNPAGIKKGTAIGLLVRRQREEAPAAQAMVRFRNFWGRRKRAELVESLGAADFNGQYEQVQPGEESFYSFRPWRVPEAYLSWPLLTDLCAKPPLNGLMEKRGGALISIDREPLAERMRRYYDREVTWEQLTALNTGLTRNAGRFNPTRTRERLLTESGFADARAMPYFLKPFDKRWCYYEPIRPLWNEPRPQLWEQAWHGNEFFLSRVSASARPEGPPFFFCDSLFDDHLLAPDASAFPVWRREPKRRAGGQKEMAFGAEHGAARPKANLSAAARSYLKGLGLPDPDRSPATAKLIWLHALAIGYSPAYLSENADGIRRYWPRIPLPASQAALRESAQLGEKVAALLSPGQAVPGVTAAPLRRELEAIGKIARVGGGQLSGAEDLALTAGYGHLDSRGAVMPGQGRVVRRDYELDELQAIEAGAATLGITAEAALTLLGRQTVDVYLNDVAYWRNIPEKVWGYVIGGYLVIKKWLSYRERPLPGRPLTPDEVHEVTDMARRLAANVLLGPTLDENYRRCAAETFPWGP